VRAIDVDVDLIDVDVDLIGVHASPGKAGLPGAGRFLPA
jgi:hypothetical protein